MSAETAEQVDIDKSLTSDVWHAVNMCFVCNATYDDSYDGMVETLCKRIVRWVRSGTRCRECEELYGKDTSMPCGICGTA